MGYFTSAYLAYGIQIPDTDEDTLDRGIPGGTEVGHLRAGKYDAEMTFLVTECTEADLGDAETVSPQQATPEQYATWDRDLKAATVVLGVVAYGEPSWLLIPNVS
jgi:hypothetical protein